MESEICTKMLRNLSEKLGANFLFITLGSSMVRIASLDDAFSGMFEMESKPSRSSISGAQTEEKEKKKAKKI